MQVLQVLQVAVAAVAASGVLCEDAILWLYLRLYLRLKLTCG